MDDCGSMDVYDEQSVKVGHVTSDGRIWDAMNNKVGDLFDDGFVWISYGNKAGFIYSDGDINKDWRKLAHIFSDGDVRDQNDHSLGRVNLKSKSERCVRLAGAAALLLLLRKI